MKWTDREFWKHTQIPGGALNFGLRAMCHQKDPTFFRSLSPKDPHFYHLSPNDPLFFNKLLVTERPWHIFVTQRPLIFAFNDKFDEMLRNFGPENPYFLLHFSERPLIFMRFVTERPPFLMQFVTERPLHLRCLVALVRHFHMWVPPPPRDSNQLYIEWLGHYITGHWICSVSLFLNLYPTVDEGGAGPSSSSNLSEFTTSRSRSILIGN